MWKVPSLGSILPQFRKPAKNETTWLSCTSITCAVEEAILAEVSVGSLNEIMKLQRKRIKIKKAENGLEDQCSDCQARSA